MDSEDRAAALSDKLLAARDARHMVTSNSWGAAWSSFERELLERLLACAPQEDDARYRLQIGIEAARYARRAIEHESGTAEGLQKEIDLLTGSKPRPIA